MKRIILAFLFVSFIESPVQAQTTSANAFSLKKFGKHFARALGNGMRGAAYGSRLGSGIDGTPHYGYQPYAQVMPTLSNPSYGYGMTTAQKIGNTTFMNGPGLQSATAQQIGNTTLSNGSGLSNTTIQKIGNIDFINGSGGYNATAQRIGNMTFIQMPSGTANAMDIGSTTFINGPGTNSGTISRIGNTSFGNFNY